MFVGRTTPKSGRPREASGDVLDPEVLLRRLEGGFAAHLADHAIALEVHLPVVVRVRVGAHGEHGPGEGVLQDLDVRGGFGDDVGRKRFPSSSRWSVPKVPTSYERRLSECFPMNTVAVGRRRLLQSNNRN